MEIRIFSFLTPMNNFHGPSPSAPTGGTTDTEQGHRGRRGASCDRPRLVGVQHLGDVWRCFRCAADVLSTLCCPASAQFWGTHTATISLEVQSEWRAHRFGLHCLSLVLISTCVPSYVVIGLIANICWLLTVCHCATRFMHITSLSLLQLWNFAILVLQMGKLRCGKLWLTHGWRAC